MGSSPDDFDSVQKVLRVKRYEQPPLRYFDEFSDRVMARIERGEARTSWWERFGFDLRPALAGGVGVFACALVVYGVATAGGDGPLPNAAGVSEFHGGAPGIAAQPVEALMNVDATSANSTNPVSYRTPIDRNIFRPQLVPASFQR
jgi:hypothetical protein